MSCEWMSAASLDLLLLVRDSARFGQDLNDSACVTYIRGWMDINASLDSLDSGVFSEFMYTYRSGWMSMQASVVLVVTGGLMSGIQYYTEM